MKNITSHALVAVTAIVGITVMQVFSDQEFNQFNKNKQSHKIVVANGTSVTIEYPASVKENISYGIGQHIMVLKEALSVLESIAHDRNRKPSVTIPNENVITNKIIAQ